MSDDLAARLPLLFHVVTLLVRVELCSRGSRRVSVRSL